MNVRKLIATGAVAATVGSGLAAVVVVGSSAASATPGPIAQHTANQVTDDALATEQIDNGVVWTVKVGTTGPSAGIAYAGGNFSNVRPPGAAAGTQLTARGNLVAINMSTGALVTSFAPTLNGQVKAVALSPDGTILYVGGAFSQAGVVGGAMQNRYHIAAYSTATGQVLSNFQPTTDATVNSISATSSTVYLGGIFSQTDGVARSRLSAVNASNGTLTGWAPTTDNDVDAVLVAPGGSRVIVAGAFENINGVYAPGSAAVDAVTGASLPWAINSVVHNYNGAQAGAILTLTTDGTSIFGTGYNYGDPNNFEGTFSADPNTGNINWLEDCHGDTYGAAPMNGAVYVVSHEHFCTNVGAFPDTNPRTAWYRSTAFTLNATGTLLNNQEGGTGYGDFGGQPSPSQINWYPSLAVGSFTGQGQAAWAVDANSQYLVEGGEFPSVNGLKQYGLVRFTIPSLAPNKMGPQIPGTQASATPNALVTSASSIRLSWQSNWDPDDTNLTYSIYRGDKSSTVPIYQTVAASQFWNLPSMGFTDSGLKAGTTYTYWLKTTDPSGNVQRSNNFNVTIPANFSTSAYAQDILNAGASHYWRLDDPVGTTTDADWAGFNNQLESSGVTNGAVGAINGDSDTAATFNGTSTGIANDQSIEPGPNVFSESMWINTTTTSGGKILGFGDSQSGVSSNYDRHVWMDNAGHIVFGVYNNGTYTITSPGAYNDGQWHQIVATLSATGMVLYIDGKKVGTNAGTAMGQPYNGYWKIGGDNLNGWGDAPSSYYFGGSIDEVAIFPTALSLSQVQQQFIDSGRTLNIPKAPTDAYGKVVYADNPDLYWRLDETSGPTALDVTPNQDNGTYNGGVTYQTPSPVTGSNGTGVTFDGSSGFLVSQNPVSNPTVYSEDLWFNTTTTNGGKLIGFGDQPTGLSGNYDRHVFMNGQGQLTFGVWTGQENEIQTSASYNDGKWHQVVATQGPDGMKLYVDGQLVGTNPQNQAQAYTGYWRVGGDTAWDGVQPWFAGSIDEVSVYSSELSASDVLAQFKASPASPNQPPVASFTSSTSNLTASFDGTGSSDPDGTVASYAWSFGDGATATGATPVHTYAAGGTYTVTLTVTDNQGATNSTQQSVMVTAPANQPPVAAFSSTSSNYTASLDASGSSDPDGTIASYAWDFGDTTTGTGKTTTHTYAAAGTYTVTLTVTDNQGATTSIQHSVTVSDLPPVAAFSSTSSNYTASLDASGSSDPDGTIASYAWDFGDTTTGSGKTTTHTYAAAGTYTVTLTVTDNQGATTSIQHSVTVADLPPVAAFTSSSSNLNASFDASGSSDPDGTIASYAWNFGDTTTGTGKTAAHTYASGGTYTVTLTVTDNQGATTSIQHSITVAVHVPPTASFVQSCANLVCTFDGTGSTDPDGTITGWAWTFGDATSASTATATHTFATAGTYQVTLTVTDNTGATGTMTAPITVTGTPLYASDLFQRTVTNGWGSANTGGAYTLTGGNSLFAVKTGAGTMNMNVVGAGPTAYLNSVSATNINMVVDATTNAQGTGNGISLVYIGRRTSAGEYHLKVRLLPGGVVHLALSKVVGGTETIFKEVVISGLTYNTGDVLRTRFTISGTGTATLTGKIWNSTATEPTAAQISVTDNTAALQTAGSVGIQSYLSGNSTIAPVLATYQAITVNGM